jgi:hypothetical protein
VSVVYYRGRPARKNRSNTDRAVSRTARVNRGGLRAGTDPYLHRPPVYKKDARIARQNAEARQAEAAS